MRKGSSSRAGSNRGRPVEPAPLETYDSPGDLAAHSAPPRRVRLENDRTRLLRSLVYDPDVGRSVGLVR